MKKYLFLILCALILIYVMFATLPPPPAPAPTTLSSPFVYSFNVNGLLQEAGSMQTSTSPYWWVNSGGELLMQNGVGETMQGEAPAGNVWRAAYAKNNPLDTDDGTHPQNLFRLVTQSMWSNISEQAQFFINADNFSASPNQNASNGLLLMSRYQDAGQTLYYAGIRVDGTAVIKKKYEGTYYTMAQKKIFPGTYSGEKENINLIPHGEWIGLRSDTTTNASGTTTVSLYMQLPGQSGWTLLLSAQDSGQYGGTPPIPGPAYGGIRTDFMDVMFRSFRIQTL